MEFALSEALPLYSGLGNVAGSSLQTARNLGLPVIDVTIVYQQSH